MLATIATAVQTLLSVRTNAPSHVECMQLVFIVTDGRTFPERSAVRRWVREARDKRILVCMVIVDSDRKSESILDVKSVTYDAKGGVVISSYMDEFATMFPDYILLREVSALPDVLATVLRQWFELSKQQQ